MAIARSLINDPYIILADEATGNLDTATSHEIMEMLGRLNDAGKTIIMVTHEDDIAEHAKRIIRMRDGLIIDDGPSPRMQAAGDQAAAGRHRRPATARPGSQADEADRRCRERRPASHTSTDPSIRLDGESRPWDASGAA